MSKDLPRRLFFLLLLCSMPAGTVLVLWAPKDTVGFVARHFGDETARVVSRVLHATVPGFINYGQWFGALTVAMALVVCGVLWWCAGTWRARPRQEGGHVFPLLLAAYAGWSALSYTWSAWPYATRAVVVRDMPFLILAAAAYFACDSRQRWLTVAKVFAVSAVAQAALQLIVTTGVARADPRKMSWKVLRGSFQKQPVFYSNKNFGCATVVTAAVIVAALVARQVIALARCRKNEEGQEASGRDSAGAFWPVAGIAAGVLCLCLLVLTLLLAKSLAGYLAGLAALVLFGFCVWVPPYARKILVAAACTYALAGAVMLGVAPLRQWAWDWAMSPRSTGHLRVIYWTGTVRMYLERPIAGWGVETFPALYPSYQTELHSRMRATRNVRTTHPHNEYLRVATELGAVGFVLFVGMISLALVYSYRALSETDLEFRLVAAALWAGLGAHCVQAAFSRAPAQYSFALGFWLLTGLLAAAHRGLRDGDMDATPLHDAPPSPVDPTLTAAALVCALLAAGWLWVDWGIGSYRSMVHLRVADSQRKALSQRGSGDAALEEFRKTVEKARRHCIMPGQILYFDYVVGWRLADLERWEEASRYLEEHVQPYSPDMLRTNSLLGRCAANMGYMADAFRYDERQIERQPYRIEGYVELAGINPAEGARRLHRHLLETRDYADLPKLRELISMYLQAGSNQGAVRVVQEACAEDPTLTAAKVVQPLARSLQEAGQTEKLAALRAVFPQATGGPPSG
jgi:O-antigen ligase